MSLKLMNEAILEYWQKSTANNWLGDRDSQELACLVEERLRELSQIKYSDRRKPQVLICESNYLKFIAAFIACLIKKVDLFLCDPNWKQTEWQQVFKLVEPDLIFGQLDKQLGEKRLLANKTPLFTGNSAIMIPTGGTSGKIKFAIHTPSTLTASVISFKEYFQVKTINSYCILPLFHVSGLMQLMRSLLTNGKLIISSYKALKQKDKPQLNKTEFFISLVPTQLQFLIDRDPLWLSKFKTVLIGGAPTARSLIEKARFYHIPLAPTYGMTETASQIVTLKPQDFLQGNNSSGKVLPHAKVTIASNGENINSQSKIGLIKIQAASLCRGYYPQLSASDREFTTDDLGWFDAAGYLHLVGRNSQKIITGGENVFPAEIEAAILATELFSDVCVIGLPDNYWGEVVTVVYVPARSPVDLDLVRQHLKATLSNYKQPKHWLEVTELPRNNRGKIDYQRVKKIASRRTNNL